MVPYMSYLALFHLQPVVRILPHLGSIFTLIWRECLYPELLRLYLTLF